MPVTLLFLTLLATPQPMPANVHVTFVSDEALAVLHILDKRAAKQEIVANDWTKLFATEGYVRLKKREHSMQREFEDDAFRTFVMSDELLARRNELRTTLNEWTSVDVSNAAKLALAYLPTNARITAKVYPVIKPKSNSFVFETDTDPAIFVYLEPQPHSVFESTVAHELHHIGYSTACDSRNDETLATPLRDFKMWLGAFGEGLATLAAAGGDAQPRLRADALEEWNKQIKRVPENFATAQNFLRAVKRGELTGDAQRKQAMELYGLVGPWYTIGWHMATTIERELGRDALLAATCDQRQLLATYNRAAAKQGNLPLWDAELANAFSHTAVPQTNTGTVVTH